MSYKKNTVSTYQCSVCFYISNLNLEVIEKFQTNKSLSYRFALWCSQSENYVPFAPECFQKFIPEFLVEWKTPLVSHDTLRTIFNDKTFVVCSRLVCGLNEEREQPLVERGGRSLLRVLCLVFVRKLCFLKWKLVSIYFTRSAFIVPKVSHRLRISPLCDFFRHNRPLVKRNEFCRNSLEQNQFWHHECSLCQDCNNPL